MTMFLDDLGGASGISFGLTAAAKAAMLLLIAALFGMTLRRQSAAARHLLWTAALVGALALPILSRFVPSLPLAVSVPRSLSFAKAAGAPPPYALSRPRMDHRATIGAVSAGKNQASAPWSPVQAAPGNRWGWVVIVWAAGAAVSLLPLVVGLLNLTMIARHASPVDEPEWTFLVRTLSDRLGLGRRVRLLRSSVSTMPITWGWLRPVVLLPRDSWCWPTERRRVVLLHELAHVKRLDCLTQQLAQLSSALYWFNPLAWWALMRMTVERERACDDLVLLLGPKPSEYAGHLLALVREQRSERGSSVVAVAMARPANLEGRLRAILDARAIPRRLGRWTAACSLLTTGAAVVSLAGLRLDAAAGEIKTRLSLPDTGRTTVRGRVFDAAGKPVAGAHVVLLAVLFRPLTFSYENTIVKGHGLADDQGRFRLDVPRVPDGDKTLVVTAPGLGAAAFTDVSGSDDGETTIRLGPEQVVRGRLIDLQGLPAAGVAFRLSELWTRHPEVTSILATTPLDEPLPPWLGPLRTDAQGRFTLGGLPRQADLTLQVRDDRFALQDFRIATGLEKSAKETVLALSPPHLLEGRITFADSGRPAAGARLHVTGYQSPMHMQSFDRIDGQAGPDGRFRISASVAHHYGIVVDPPQGSPYFLRRLTPVATAGVRQEIDVTLKRGILVRGQIRESSSRRPVAGAIVVYRPGRKKNPRFKEDLFATGGYHELSAVSGVDGSFQLAALPGPGHLLVKGPNSEFVPVRTSEGQLEDDAPGGARLYPDGLLALDLQANATVADVSIPLHRGATLEGRVVGPDGQTVPGGDIYSEAIASVGFDFDFSGHPIRNGRFTLTGLDPEKTISAFIFDAKTELGASLELSVPRDGRPVTVTLHPCGAARARFVDRAGKPFATVMPLSSPRFGLEMVLRLSPSANPSDRAGQFATTLVDNIDGGRYQTLRTDAQGQLTFPSLIPGATYRVMVGEQGWVARKEFVAEAGKTVDLAEITIVPPQ